MINKLLLACLLVLLWNCSPKSESNTENQVTLSFKVNGLVEQEQHFTATSLLEMQQLPLGNIQLTKGNGQVYLELNEASGVLLKDVLLSVTVKGQNNKNYSAYYVVCTAADGYKTIYSWNELFNSPIGEQVYLITQAKEQALDQMEQAIMMVSLGDQITGKRNLRNLAIIEIACMN